MKQELKTTDMKLMQFGAGNIGRSFIAQIFSINGYEVVFVDIDHVLIDKINSQGHYPVVIKDDGKADETLIVNRVRGVYADDIEAVIQEFITSDIIATSVGKNALPHIIPTLAAGIINRFNRATSEPVNIILAENLQQGKEFVEERLLKALGRHAELLSRVGIIETSIGKMVPIVSEEVKEKDPLLVFAEPYNTLILDKSSFIGPIPNIPQIHAVDHIDAYVARKLFIHNLGHAAVAYIGYSKKPEATYTYEILEDEDLKLLVKQAMEQSARALHLAYPAVFSNKELDDHIEDLLRRFTNRALKDTIYRVGRDLSRKLHRSDRVIGAIELCYHHDQPCDVLLQVLFFGFTFTLAATVSEALLSDTRFIQETKGMSIEETLQRFCGLDSREDKQFRSFLVSSLRSIAESIS